MWTQNITLHTQCSRANAPVPLLVPASTTIMENCFATNSFGCSWMVCKKTECDLNTRKTCISGSTMSPVISWETPLKRFSPFLPRQNSQHEDDQTIYIRA